jgi:hypothetical protein
MTYMMLLNLEKILEWELGKTTAFVMGVFADLESWADKTVIEEDGEPEVYYTLYRSKVIADLPFVGSKSSVSRAIGELEEKGIIVSTNKNSTPAYRLTEKGMEWKRKPGTGAAPEQKKEKQSGVFSLGKKTRAEKLSPDYYKLLQQEARNICNTQGIPFEEFGKFFDHHASKGNAFVNWLSAFRNWTRNYKRFNPDAGENQNGLYE